MRQSYLISIPAIALISAACAAPADPIEPPAGAGSGGMTSVSGSSSAVGAGGSSTASTTVGSGGAVTTYATAVGASYKHSGDARVVLVDSTGERSVLFNPGSGAFESADDIDELEGGMPLENVGAAANVGDTTYFFDSTGQVVVYNRPQATFGPTEELTELLEDVPFPSVGAAFGLGDQLFVFAAGGTSYAAYDVNQETWSPVYSFLTDFGGGGAPIASVGSAYVDDNGAVTLFDLSGTSYCIYSGGGQFSDDFDIEELGDGALSFNDD